MPDQVTSPVHRVAEDLDVTVSEAVQWLQGLDAAAVEHRPAADRWTVKEVIGHLIDSAANNHHRFVRAQFVPELTFPAYEQNDWVACQAYNEVDWPELLELWRRYNRHLSTSSARSPRPPSASAARSARTSP